MCSLIYICIVTVDIALLLNASGKVQQNVTINIKPVYMNLPQGSKFIWPNKTVPYQLSDQFNATEKRMFNEAVKWWHRNTCVRWLRKQSDHKNFVNITKTSERCFSKIGKRSGAQNMALKSSCFDKRLRTVHHEMMHAIGFIHEHQRPDRDLYIIIHKENISIT